MSDTPDWQGGYGRGRNFRSTDDEYLYYFDILYTINYTGRTAGLYPIIIIIL